jgi:hypothetical protein
MLPQFYALLCDAERVKKLLEEGADPNIRDGDGNTPLHFAASKGCAEVARLLLEHGADPNAQDKSGETPLHVAASMGHVDVVRLLLERGADPSIRNREGKTPLDIARERGHREVVSLIEGWLGRGGKPSRPGAAPVRSASDAVCEACCEAWRIISQVYGHVKEARAMTAKELEDLEDLFHIFKGSVVALEEAATEVAPDAVRELVRELVSAKQLIESILSQLKQGNLPSETLENITYMYFKVNRLRKKLACRC